MQALCIVKTAVSEWVRMFWTERTWVNERSPVTRPGTCCCNKQSRCYDWCNMCLTHPRETCRFLTSFPQHLQPFSLCCFQHTFVTINSLSFYDEFRLVDTVKLLGTGSLLPDPPWMEQCCSGTNHKPDVLEQRTFARLYLGVHLSQ